MPSFEILEEHETLESVNKFDPVTHGLIILYLLKQC